MKLSHFLAGLLFSLGLLVQNSAFAQTDVVVTDLARQHFKAGVAYIEDPTGPKYEEAYREFHKAYSESPTYKIMTNIGLCALNLERDGEAIDAYTKFLARAKPEDIPKEKRTLMERDIAMLKSSLVTLTVTSKLVTVTLSDERLPSKGSNVTNRYELKGGTLSLGIHPGHHRITASAEGYEPQTWDFEADSSTTHQHDFTLTPVAPKAEPTAKSTPPQAQTVTTPPETNPKKSTPTLVYVGVAATGVFAIAAAVTGLIANSKKSDYDSANATGDDQRKARDLRDSFKQYALMTDIGIGAAIVSAGATAIIYFTAPNKKQETKPIASRIHIEPTVSPAHAGLSLSGQF